MAGVFFFPNVPLLHLVASVGQSEQRTLHKRLLNFYFSHSEWSQYKFALSHCQGLNYPIIQRLLNLQDFDNFTKHANKNYVNIKLSSICYQYLHSRPRELFTVNAFIEKIKNQATITGSSTKKKSV